MKKEGGEKDEKYTICYIERIVTYYMVVYNSLLFLVVVNLESCKRLKTHVQRLRYPIEFLMMQFEYQMSASTTSHANLSVHTCQC